ncbi:MAG: DUF1295 domain-containing protein [Christensenellaceae bacterium]|nr:DUF1295 domain-containing protein [Christensenellaceae bacterium]
MEKLKNSRAASFIAVTVIYVIAAAAGIIVYKVLDFEMWINLLIADAAATVVTFIFSLVFKNASVYDPYWSVQPIFILVCFAIGVKMTAARVLMIIAVAYWAVRLTANWAYTFHGLKHQDWRYTMLNETTGVFYPVINFIGIHMVPTLIVYGCTLPAVYLMLNDTAWNVGTIVFFAVSIGAATLQLFADIQMQRFRKNRTSPFIRTGLWKYSRHPNYLGEILMWWGVALQAVCVMPEKWYLIAGAAANTVLFLVVSIPMADKRQGRKEGFEEYKKQTRMLLPIKK